MRKIIVSLEEKDLMELQAILMDRDAPAALQFLESRVAAKLPQKRTEGCDSTHINPYLVKTGGKKASG